MIRWIREWLPYAGIMMAVVLIVTVVLGVFVGPPVAPPNQPEPALSDETIYLLGVQDGLDLGQRICDTMIQRMMEADRPIAGLEERVDEEEGAASIGTPVRLDVAGEIA